MHREQGHLQRNSNDEEGKADEYSVRFVETGKEAGEVSHVQRTRYAVEISYRKQIESGPDGSKDYIAEGRHNGHSSTERNQGIAGKGSDFEKDVEVEHVSR